MVAVGRDAKKELAVAKAALSALSGLPDEEPVAAHADAISDRLGWAAKLVGRLDGE
ncbi:MAG TPA: hypothetical protein VIU40_14290 [Geobacteraceae bacterium]